MIKEQKTTSRNGVFFSVMRGGLLEGKKKTRKEILKMISSNSAATWFYRARERERGLHEENDLGKSIVAAGEKSKMTQKRKLKRLVS
jgi:hypothetical protein